MSINLVRLLFLVVLASSAAFSHAYAKLRYSIQTMGDVEFLLIEGDFDLSDDLSRFYRLVRNSNPSVVVFNSPGGNLAKAMELGRAIRKSGLNTVQIRAADCSSACSLAFLGGVKRSAMPGSIGVHKSSYHGPTPLSTDEAISSIQQVTAEVITYIVEMGADPALLQLALKYESDDIQYLSKSEMERYRVTNDGPSVARLETRRSSRSNVPDPSPAPNPRSSVSLEIPKALRGVVRHPKGSITVKQRPGKRGANLFRLNNGHQVLITGEKGNWYQIRAGDRSGYAHNSWLRIGQFEGGNFDERHIQIKSFKTLEASINYITTYKRKFSWYDLPMAVHLASNGWFAITIDDTYELNRAKTILKGLKSKARIPEDSFVTYGNTYVRKVCCQ